LFQTSKHENIRSSHSRLNWFCHLIRKLNKTFDTSSFCTYIWESHFYLFENYTSARPRIFKVWAYLRGCLHQYPSERKKILLQTSFLAAMGLNRGTHECFQANVSILRYLTHCLLELFPVSMFRFKYNCIGYPGCLLNFVLYT
jgi:hypothetical protein